MNLGLLACANYPSDIHHLTRLLETFNGKGVKLISSMEGNALLFFSSQHFIDSQWTWKVGVFCGSNTRKLEIF